LKEATALLGLGLFDGAYYLAGYAVECGLEACIAKGTARHEFPDKRRVDSSHSHNLRELVRVARLSDVLAERIGKDPGFGLNWTVVQAWTEQSRYQKHHPDAAHTLVAAVGNRHHGVISWIKLHW